MAKLHGKNANLQLTDSGAVNRNLSNFLSSIDFPGTTDTAEVSAFGDTDKSYVIGLRSHTIKFSGFWDPTATTGPDDVLAGLKGGGASGTVTTVFIHGPGGTAGGAIKYTGTAILTEYTVNSPIGGAITFSGALQVTGPVTRTTF